MTQKISKQINEYLQNTDIHIFNYEDVVKHCIEIVFEHSTRKELKLNLTILSKVLHKYLWNDYEEVMRDKEVWNTFYNNMIKSMNVSIAEISKKNDNEGQGVETQC